MNRDAEDKPTAYRYWPIAAVFSIGLAGTALLAGILRHHTQHVDQTRFNTMTHFVQELLDDRVEKCEQALGLMRELFNLVELPSQVEWRQLLDRIKLPTNNPGLVQVGYAPRLTSAQLAAPSSALRAAMGTNFIRPEPLGQTRVCMPVLYLTSQPPLLPSPTGFCLETTLVKPLINNARDRNANAASRCLPLGLPQPSGAMEGFYLLQPVYDPNLPVDTQIPDEDTTLAFQRLVKGRVTHLRGAIFGAIQMDLLLENMLEHTPMEIAFEIFDGPKLEESKRLNNRMAIPSSQDRSRRLDLANRVSSWRMYGERWTIVFYPTAEFERASPRRDMWIALTAGLLTTLLVTGLVWQQLLRRFSVESYAHQMNEARDLIDSLSQERQQISRDLHDNVLQSLYAISLGLQKERKVMARNPMEAIEICGHNLETIESTMGELRRYLHMGSHQPLNDFDLIKPLRRMVSAMNRQGCVPVQFQADACFEWSLRSELALQLLQIAREAISNAQRHSGAKLVQVALHARDGGLEMKIADDGRGFDSDRPPGIGYGLPNMLDRARKIGADYQLQTHPGQGVRITVFLPAAGCVAPCLKPTPSPPGDP
jgi:signal transduction histidine kinase